MTHNEDNCCKVTKPGKQQFSSLFFAWWSIPDFAENRLKLAEILYYKVLENVLAEENRRLNGKDMSVSIQH